MSRRCPFHTGVPKWSPLYTGKQKPPGTPVAASPQQKTAQKVLGVPDNLKAKSVNPKPGELSAQQKMNYGFGIPRWSPYAPTGYRVSKGSESHEYGSYTKQDYLIKLAAYLRELAIQSGEDLKMQPAPVHEIMSRRVSTRRAPDSLVDLRTGSTRPSRA